MCENISKKTLQIGVLLGNAQTEHPREIISGVFDVAQVEDVKVTFFLGAQGRALDFWNEDSDFNSLAFNYQYNSLYDYALIGSFDALIVSYGTLCIYLNELERASFLPKFKNIPLIILEKNEKDSPHSFIMTDNYGSMYTIVEHLITVHGYKNILHVSGPKYSVEAELRKQAYLDAMRNHGLTVTDSMIAEGDFTYNVTHIIEKLLDDNPDAEAINCANDETAMAAYKVCNQRNIVVGRDMAITGYDDIDTAAKLDPPLTTANQDGIDMGYRAVKATIAACNDKGSSISELITAPLMVRGSCGCDFLSRRNDTRISDSFSLIKSLDDEELISTTVSYALDTVRRKKNVPDNLANSFKASYDRFVRALIKIRQGKFTENDFIYLNKATLDSLRSMISGDYEEFTRYISINRFMNSIRTLITYEINNEQNFQKTMLLNNLNCVISEYIEALIVQNNAEVVESLYQNNWSIPSGIQSMMEKRETSNELYKNAMILLKEHGIKNAFMYLNRVPIIIKRNNPTFCPKTMSLAAKMINGEIDSYILKDAPTIDRKNGFTKLYPDSSSDKQYSVFLLFQEDKQFGLLICETDYSTIDTIFGIALQISTALAFLHLHIQEAVAQQKLIDAMVELEEKNKVLSFISSNDALTNLYNRRGFMEKVFSMLRSNEGKKAYLFFFDLDHLKEINDVFGHAEGDFAIIHAAEYLKELFGDNGFCARLGGDEFVGVITDDSSSNTLADDMLAELDDIEYSFNLTSQKPYYIEFSAGYTSFVFNNALDIDAVLKGADNVLYEAKKKRRTTIKKEL